MTEKKTRAGSRAKPRRRLGMEGQQRVIREAAMVVFAERGLEEATVEDVLERAGVSRQTFYRCYRGKSDVLEAVHELVTSQLMAVAERMRGSDQPLELALRQHVRLLFDHVVKSGPIVCVLEREAMRPDSPYHVHRQRRHRFAERFLALWIYGRMHKWPSKPLVKAVVLALDQLVRDVAETGGRSRRQRAEAEQAAYEVVEALLLHTERRREDRATA